ncbi:MAG: glycosyltransferase family 39 protein [Chloroflexota bacterium]|nr:glycosyltransferase family 39 protein [Dehalococcoidia bacterium]MDW8253967.1 glycosyltransferase family 39 protein [Chloroflexota bacterium]
MMSAAASPRTVPAETAVAARRPSSVGIIAWAAVGLVLAGFALRIVATGEPSYWGDEMVSVTVARMPAAAIPGWLAENDPHPPLYYLALHGWVRLAGERELATRALSALLGALAIPLVGALARRLLSPAAAVVAMTLIALNPLQVDQARDARMYPLLVALTLGATLVLWRQLSRPSVAGWTAYALLGAAALYTHYYGGLALIAHGLWVLTLLPANRRIVLQFAAAGAGITLLYLPWLLPGLIVITAYEGYGWATGESGIGSWPQAVARCLQVFLTGPWTPDAPWNSVAAGFAVALAAGGAVAAFRCDRRAALLLTLLLLVPITIIYVASLQRPLFMPRYLIIASPAFLLLAAAVIAALRGWLAPAGVALAASVLLVQGVGVDRLLTDPRYANADWRAAARFVAARERPNDGIVYGHDGMKWLFGFYHPGGPGEYIPPFAGKERRQEIEEMLRRFTAVHERVWFVPWWNSDTDVIVERWLTDNAYLALDRWIDRSVRLLLFASPSGTAPLQPSGTAFGGILQLDSWAIDRTTASQGDVLRVDLRWMALEPVEEEVRRLLVLRDRAGRRFAVSDRAPRNAPTAGWPKGRALTDRVGLLVPPGTPAGEYELAVGLYAAATGAPLVPTAPAPGGLLRLGTVRVSAETPRFDPAAVDADRPLAIEVEPGIRLVGVSVAPGPRRQGDRLEITTFWQPLADGAAATIRLGLADRAIASRVGGLPAGAVERRDLTLRVPPTLPPGRYALWVAGEGSRVTIETIEVVAAPPLPAPAPPAQIIEARFGDIATLVGATIRREGGATEVRLLWQAEREVDQELAVFVHLLDEAGRIVAQADGLPANGAAPTSRWTPGLRFDDIRRIASDAPGRIIVGLYDPATLERVPTGSGDSVQVAP